MTMQIPSSVRFDAKTDEQLNELVKLSGHSKSYLIRESVERTIDQLLWEYKVLNTAREIKSGTQKTYSREDIEKLIDGEVNPDNISLDDIE